MVRIHEYVTYEGARQDLEHLARDNLLASVRGKGEIKCPIELFKNQKYGFMGSIAGDDTIVECKSFLVVGLVKAVKDYMSSQERSYGRKVEPVFYTVSEDNSPVLKASYPEMDDLMRKLGGALDDVLEDLSGAPRRKLSAKDIKSFEGVYR